MPSLHRLSPCVRRPRRWAESAAGRDDWLNDGVEGFVSVRQNVQDAGLNLPHLPVTMPVPEYLLAMKCTAARIEPGSRDFEDAKFLIRHLQLLGSEAVLAIVENYYPPN